MQTFLGIIHHLANLHATLPSCTIPLAVFSFFSYLPSLHPNIRSLAEVGGEGEEDKKENNLIR